MDYAIKRVAPDTVEGLAIPFGGMFTGGRDLEGERFTKTTDFVLDLYDSRPLIYHHGLDAALKAQAVGRQTEYEVREEGIWAQSQLKKNATFRRAIDQLIEEGALGYSSGSLGPHHVKTAGDGSILYWPWAELSLTPTPAAGQLSAVHHVKASDFLDHCEEADVLLSVAAVKAIADLLDRNATPDPESLDEKAGRVSAAISEFRDHARSSAEMRTKAGRVLSAANRDRIAKALASKDAVLGAYADLEALLNETDPVAASKAMDALWAARIEFEATEARARGVALT